MMSQRRLILLASFLMVASGCHLSEAWAAGPGGGVNNAAAQPNAGATLILTMDYRGGMLLRPPTPYLQIFANGAVVVTNVNGTQKHARLTQHQLQQLLAYVNQQNQFLTLSTAQIANAIAAQNPVFLIGDGTTTIIAERVNKTTAHTVSVYAADTYLGAFPNIKPLAEFVAIEQRLQQVANSAK
jgi:hypothetical protein